MTTYLVLLAINTVLVLLVALCGGSQRKEIHPLFVVAGVITPLAMPVLFILAFIEMYLSKSTK